MYGYEKVIVMELHREWDLVMRPGGEILRIHKKEGLHVGDVIYILPEDILEAATDNKILFFPTGQKPAADPQEPPKTKKKSSHQHKILLRQLASVAAIFAICFSVLLFSNHLPVQVYAVASFDAAQGLQVELDQNLRILSVTSVDGSIPESMLAALKGRQLQDVESELRYLIGNGPCLLGYAPQSGEADPLMELQLRALLSDRGTLLLTGTAEDIPAAKESNLSLGQYIAGQQMHRPDQDMLDDWENLSTDELEQMLQMLMKTPHWTEKEDFREAVEDLQEDLVERQEEEAEKVREEAEEKESGNDNEEVKEEEDDEAEDDDTENPSDSAAETVAPPAAEPAPAPQLPEEDDAPPQESATTEQTPSTEPTPQESSTEEDETDD